MLKSPHFLTRTALLLVAVLASVGFVGGGAVPATWFVPDGATLSAAQMGDLFDTNRLYVDVRSATSGNGEIRGAIIPSTVIYRTDAGDPFAANPAATPVTFAALLGGDQVRPRSVITGAGGYGSVTLDPQSRILTGFVVTSGIVGSAVQIHDGLPGSSGSVIVTLEGGPVVWTVPVNTVLTEAQAARLSAGAHYFDVRSDAFPNGELRGQLTQQVRFATLNGASEVPPVSSAASGSGVLALNPATGHFSGCIKVVGLGSAVISADIHLGDTVTNGPFIVDLVNSGNGIWSVPIINNPVLSSAVIAAFNNDQIYVNIHTQAYPDGELRGRFMQSVVKIGTSVLNGSSVVPPVATAATGSGLLAWNSVTEQVSGSVVSDITAGTASEIHSGSADGNGPALIALTTTSPVTVVPTPGVSFGLDIQPIFNTSCARSTFCHTTGGRAPMSLQSGVSYANIINILIPGDAASSYLYQRLTINNPPTFPQMPLNRPPLSSTEQNLVKEWINRGALFDFYSAGVTLAVNPAGPQSPGTPITFTAAGQGGSGSYQYRFWLNSGSGYSIVQDYGAADSWVWTPTATGAYDILVDVRNAGSTTVRDASAKIFYYQILPAEAAGVVVTPDLTSPQTAGTPITFTALGQGGSGSYQYRFWLNSGSGYSIVQEYSSANSWVWTPGAAGAYDILVDVRNTGSSALRESSARIFYYQIQPTGAAGVTITSDLSSPRTIGTPVTFTAAGQGGSGIYEYRFWLNSGSGYSIVQEYGAANSWVWTPGTTGAYDILVDVRNAGSTTVRDASAKMFYYQIQPAGASGVVVTPDLSSPQAAGTSVTFTAVGQGGSGSYHYRFWLNSGSGYSVVQEYGAANSYVWTPAAAGAYDLLVDVRNAGSAAFREASAYVFYYQVQ